MKSKRPWPYTVIGIFFLLFACVTAINIVAGWYLANTFLWLATVYTVLNITTAVALFRRERWLLWAFSANTLSSIVLAYFSSLHAGTFYSLSSIGVIANILLLYYCYHTRAKLRTTSGSYALATLFSLAWITSVGYSIYILFI